MSDNRVLLLLFLAVLLIGAVWLVTDSLAPTTNTSVGVLSEVTAQYTGNFVGTRSTWNFSGAGVTMSDNTTNNRINVDISGASGAPSGASYVTINAEAGLSAESILAGTADRISISSATIDIAATYAGQSTITTLGTIGTGVWQGTPIADAYIPNTITLDAITQITSRSHTSLSDIGTNTHAQVDTHIADSTIHFAQASITTVGTIGTGVWQGTTIKKPYIAYSTGAGDANTLSIHDFLTGTPTTNYIPKWNGTGWAWAADGGGSGGGAPTDAQYVTLATHGNLTAERVLVGTSNRLTVTDGGAKANVTLNISASYVGQATITTVGAIGTGTWNSTAIIDSYIASASVWNAKESALTFTSPLSRSTNTISLGGLSSVGTGNYVVGVNSGGIAWEYKQVLGTANRLSVANATNSITFDISSAYVGQNTITTVGAIGTGTWNGTPLADAYIYSAATWNAKPDLQTAGSSGTAMANAGTNTTAARSDHEHYIYRDLGFFVSYNITVGDPGMRVVLPEIGASGDLFSVMGVLGTAGTTNTTIDVLKSSKANMDAGTPSWSSVFTTKLNIGANNLTSNSTPPVIGTSSWTAGDYYRINVDAGGTGATNMTIQLRIRAKDRAS